MKKTFTILMGLTLALAGPMSVHAATQPLVDRLSGRILLQVQSYGRAWYVNPVDGSRYYMQDGNAAYDIMRTLGLGISDKDLAKIPTAKGKTGTAKLVARLSGRILLQVQQLGEAWYVNPVDGLRYYLKDGAVAYDLMRTFALGITNKDLRTIPMNTKQIVQDTTFDDVAYVKVHDGAVVAGKNADQILPPASMTKLMTALVFLDQHVDWATPVTVTQFDIDYPSYYAGEDATSEVPIMAGDVVTVNDLWISLLVASSNQAAITLVDNSGLSRNQFIEAMNTKAKALGLTHTLFYDPSGLDAHTVTTPREMAVIAARAFSEPKVLEADHSSGYQFQTQNSPSRTITVADRNYSLQAFAPDASKTGFLDEAQRCVSLKKGSDIVVVMHARSMSERNTILKQLLGS